MNYIKLNIIIQRVIRGLHDEFKFHSCSARGSFNITLPRIPKLTISARALSSGKTEDGVHELIIIDLDPPITVGVETAERFAKLFDDDAGADKSIERDAGGRSSTGNSLVGLSIIFLLYEVKQRGRQVVSKLSESVAKFCTVNSSGTITVEMSEDVLPVLDILPQTRELVETDRSATVCIED